MAHQVTVVTRVEGHACALAQAAALAGVLSVGAALALGQLAAGLLNSADASPYLAVGETFIDHVSAPLKEFAVRSFGTGDKTVLLAGMGVVLLGFGVLAGLVS